MADVSVVFNAIGKDSGVSSLLDKFKSGFRSTGAVGAASMKVVDHETEKLNDEIEKAQRNLKQLARDFALATVGAERASISAAMRKQNTELGKITKARDLIKPEVIEEAGALVGDGISNGILSKVAANNPALIAGLAGVALAAAPYIGSTISLAVIGSAAAGGIIGGVTIAAKDARVQAAWKTFATGAGNALKQAAAPFVPATLGAIKIIQDGFTGLQPVLKSVFSSASGYVKPLADGIVGLIAKIGPGFSAAVAAAGPVISVLAAKLPEVGAAIGDLFQTAADNADNAAEALGIILNAVTGIILGLSTVVGWLGKVADANRAIGGDGLLRWIGLIDDVPPATTAAESSSMGFVSALDATGKAAETSAEKIKRLNDASNDLAGANLSLYDAQTKAKGAIAAATKEIDKNGRSHSANTEAGRKNRDALVSLASAFNAATGANDKANVSAGKSEKDFARQRAAFIKAAEAAGYTNQKARELADSILTIPKARTTKIEQQGGSAVRSMAVDVGRALAKIPRTINVRIVAKAVGVSSANAAIKLAGKLAGGGPMKRNLPYLVGEEGPELVIPDNDGMVSTASETRATLTGSRSNTSPSMLASTVAGRAYSGGSERIAVVRVEGERRIAEVVRYLIRSIDLVGNAAA